MEIRVHCRCAFKEEIRLIQIFIIYHFVYIPLHRPTAIGVAFVIITTYFSFFFLRSFQFRKIIRLFVCCAHFLIIPLQITLRRYSRLE